MLKRMFAVAVISLALLSLAFSPVLAAEKWPTGPITMIVPFKAGGGLDVVGRLLAKHWEKELGVPIRIENRGGANGQIGTMHYLTLPDDGSSLLMNAQLYYSSTILTQNAPYKIDDIELLNFVELAPNCVAVAANASYNTFSELNDAILQNPGKIKFAVSPGSPGAIAVDYLINRLGWKVKIVNYDGGTDIDTALPGGHVDATVLGIPGTVQRHKVLAVWADERFPPAPEVPTLQEVLGGEKLPFIATSRFVAVHASVKEKYPDRYRILLETLERASKSPDYLKDIESAGRADVTVWIGPEKSNTMNHELHELAEKYKSSLIGS
jgi:Uncharacterized protein conserved in bacteria